MSEHLLFRRVARQARSAWPRIAALLLVGLLASPLALLTPMPLKLAVDSVLNSHPLPGFLDAVVPAAVKGSPAALLVFVAGLAVLIALLGQLQTLVSKYLSVSTGERLVLEFRSEIFSHLQRLSVSYHDSVGTADSVYRVQNDAPAVRNIIIEGFIPVVGSAVTLAAMLYVTVRIDWQLALVALAVSPPLLLVSRAYRPRLRKQSREVKKVESSALSVVHEALGALRVVKAFGQEAREGARFERRSDAVVGGRIRLALAEGRFNIVVGLITGAGTAGVLLIGIGHVHSGLLSLGDLLLVMGYIAKLYEPMKTIGRKVATLQSHLASAERGFAILDQVPDVTERAHARAISRARGAVAFRDVSFAYGSDRPVLHNISFTIDSGTRLGIMGATGAGKSTLLSLLTRLYDPTAGQILLDGVDLRDYRLDDLRRQFAVVLQDAVLFSTTIAENIAYAMPGASRERIVAAAEAADAHEFIERLPQGYDSQVGERGVKLSGGQRQRIALARAFLRDSPVLILDEPTSSVDAQTEAAIVEALERLKRGRTVIIISHRPATLAGCSTLLALEHGRVVSDTNLAGVASRRLAASTTAPAITATKRRQDKLLAHPAVRAWQQLGPERPLPDRVAPAKVKPYKRDTPVYRLEGVGPDGTAVIAKACSSADVATERIVYERYLPRLHLPTARYYGSAPSADQALTWLFLGELHGDEYSAVLSQHRAFASGWLAALHADAEPLGTDPLLRDAGPPRYLDHLRAARRFIRAHVDNPVLGGDDVAFLTGLLSRFDELEQDWDRLVHACSGLPQTLVHGDFSAKNVRVQAGAPHPGLVAFDWEDAGWGVPAADLAQMALPSSRIAASPDLAAYWDIVRERWPACDRSDIERLAHCGSVFRSLAALQWDSHHLEHEWAQWFVRSMRLYEAELTHALDRLGPLDRAVPQPPAAPPPAVVST